MTKDRDRRQAARRKRASCLELMTHAHGRHLGLVRGGALLPLPTRPPSRELVQVVWRARLDEQLGTYPVERTNLRAAQAPGALLSRSTDCRFSGALSAFCRSVIPILPCSRSLAVSSSDALHMRNLRPRSSSVSSSQSYPCLGVGLDSCRPAPRQGYAQDLLYVSPRTGRAVSAAAGEAWQDRLLTLPAFMSEGQGRLMPVPVGLLRVLPLLATSSPGMSSSPRGWPDARGSAAFIAAATRGVPARCCLRQLRCRGKRLENNAHSRDAGPAACRSDDLGAGPDSDA